MRGRDSLASVENEKSNHLMAVRKAPRRWVAVADGKGLNCESDRNLKIWVHGVRHVKPVSKFCVVF